VLLYLREKPGRRVEEEELTLQGIRHMLVEATAQNGQLRSTTREGFVQPPAECSPHRLLLLLLTLYPFHHQVHFER
jgi:hypothetical protein